MEWRKWAGHSFKPGVKTQGVRVVKGESLAVILGSQKSFVAILQLECENTTVVVRWRLTS